MRDVQSRRLARVLILVFIQAVLAGLAAGLAALKIDWPAWIIAGMAGALGVLVANLLRPWTDATVNDWLSLRQRHSATEARASEVIESHQTLRSRKLRRLVEYNPRELGVQPSIGLSNKNSPAGNPSSRDLPQYIPRDVDSDLRTAIRAAAQRGGFLLLIGEPSSGKTRTAYEAARSEVPDWPMIIPRNAAEISQIALSEFRDKRLVLWLDELQKFLASPEGLTEATIRRLLAPDTPTIIVGTIWPYHFDRYTREASVDPITGAYDDMPYPGQRGVLRLAERFPINAEFSEAERMRAAVIAPGDLRVADALVSRNYGVTQVLAAAPDLVHHWEQAQNPYSKALITAAIDCRRVGYTKPLTAKVLQAATPCYLRDQDRAAAPTDWFATAVQHSSQLLRGVTPAIISVPGRQVGTVLGYTVADYLLQHGLNVRRTEPVPDALWTAMLGSVADTADLISIGQNAQSRFRLGHAEAFFRRAVELGDINAWNRLAALLEYRESDEAALVVLKEAAQQKRLGAWQQLGALLQRLGQPAEAEAVFRTALEAGEPDAWWHLRQLLLTHGRDAEAEQMLSRIPAGHPGAWQVLAYKLRSEYRFAEAERIVRQALDSGEPDAWWGVANLLRDSPDRFEQTLREAFSLNQPGAWEELSNLLQGQQRFDEAEEILRTAILSGHAGAAEDLYDLLIEHGRDLEARALRIRGLREDGTTDRLED